METNLTPRETEVISRFCNDEPVKQIASNMQISESTANTHLANIRRKLHVGSTHRAVIIALRLNLISLF